MGVRLNQQILEVWAGLPPEFKLTEHDLEVFGLTPANWFLTEHDLEVFGLTPPNLALTEFDAEVFGSTIAALSFTPSGGLIFSGTAPVTPPANAYTGTGGLTFGGSATYSHSSGPDFQIDGSGGLLFGGTSPLALSIPYTPSGGLTFGGTGEPYRIGIIPSGGLVFDGTSTITLNVHYVPSGGLTFSGTSPTTLGGRFLAGQAVFDNGFKYRKLVTVPAGKASANLTNFPVLVRVTTDDQPIAYKYSGNGGLTLSGSADLVSSNWRPTASGGLTFGGSTLTVVGGNSLVVQEVYSVTPSGGLSLTGLCPARYGLARSDFAFEVRCNHTALSFDVDQFDAITGTLTAWVQLPTLLSKEDNELYCYYGGTNASDLSANAWDSNFSAVYHFNDFGDDTANNLDGTAANETELGTVPSPTPLGGKIGDARRFDGNDWLSTGADNINVNDDITIEAWVRPTQALNGRLVILSRGENDLDNGYGCSILLGLDENQKPWAKVQTVDGTWSTTEAIGPTALTLNSWAHLAAVWTRANSLKVYLNGSLVATEEAADGSLVPYSGVNQIGRVDTVQYYRGDLDELRLSRLARSADWLLTTYRTGDDSTFALVGNREHALHLWGCPTFYVVRNTISGSGGLTFSGTAPAKQLDYMATGSGGLTLTGSAKIGRATVGTGGLGLGGAAVTRLSQYKASGSGGLTLASSAPFKVGYKKSGSGSINLAGSAPVKQGYSITPTGGLDVEGTSSGRYVPRFTVTPSGGLALSGTTQPGRVVWGGLTLSGSAKIGRRYLPSGGLELTGQGIFTARRTHVGTGGLSLGSTAPARVVRYNVTGSGGLSLSGTTQPGRVVWGGLSLSGSATVKRAITTTTSGGLELGGLGIVALGQRYLPTGGLHVQGSGNIGRAATGNGGLGLSGSAKIGRRTTGTGGMSLSNSATVKLFVALPTSGGLVLSGQAALSTWYARGSGGLALAGSATALTPSFALSGSGGLRFSRFDIPAEFGGTVRTGPSMVGEITVEPSLGGSSSLTRVFAGEVAL